MPRTDGCQLRRRGTAAGPVATTSYGHLATVKGTLSAPSTKRVCKVPNLLKGTKVSLQYKVGSHWVTIGTAKAGKATVSWSARFAKTGTYAVRVVVAASRIFAGSTSASAKFVVH
jgi:hypothetical protein